MALMGLVVDGGSAMSAQQSAYDEAEQAARLGPVSFRSMA